MTSEIAKCAWCGKEPRGYKGKIFCDTFGCLSDVNCPRDLANWNLWQKRSIDMRRKDFEAGRLMEGFCDEPPTSVYYDFDEYIRAEAKHGEEEK